MNAIGSPIEKIAVIGAGVMGAGIAAQVANAGVPVLLLDIVPEGATDRNVLAEGAIARLLKSAPAAFMHRRNAALVTPGNLDDDLDKLGDRDWIIEAIVERADLKRALYRRIEDVRRPGSVVSSNTSTIPLSVLREGLPERFAGDFMITHFFNPPRYLRLLELAAGPATRDDAIDAIADFADRRLGKTVVRCKDRPGFIANRIGIYWLQCAVVHAIDAGLTVEEADAALGRPIGAPKTGVFGLLDMVGLDLMPAVLDSMAQTLPADDPFHAVSRRPEVIEWMLAEGLVGRKGKGGFYRLEPGAKRRVKQALDLGERRYRVAVKPDLQSVRAARKGGLKALLEHADKGGRYAWWVMSRTLAYAARLVPEVADDIVAVDQAMRRGYNWKHGPFELIDRLGVDWFAARILAIEGSLPAMLERAAGRSFYRVRKGRLEALAPSGEYRPVERPPGVLLLADVKRRAAPLARNPSASLWDLGDGVVCLEFHSKMNALDPLSLRMIGKAIRVVEARHKALVIHNEGENFSVGANIGLLLLAMKLRLRFVALALVRQGQNTYKALKYAPFPVVGAPSGMALGGGLEVLLHCDAIQAHAETYAGLVEVGVGIVPAWGGCKELLARWTASKDRAGGPMPPVIKVFETVGMATVAKSAAEARDYLFLRPGDGITMNRDRLLADAKARALELAETYTPPAPPRLSLPGATARAAMTLAVDGLRLAGKASAHDATVAKALAGVLSGGDTDIVDEIGEDELLALERRAFASLVGHPASLARVAHMLKTGRPLRN